ncbi:HipA N-terminal domain-containing protein [Tsukamurella sp. PLM1]|uniref:HipA N-terminal domain-containing protein n=1 Tax=Tsukamurella sp. PLM1 TaxID=2929795 RepID=UPI0020515910|nr:HipA N-terminal domain-containing protein [Tsukamurella sp. PLM1]BDH57363.1 hypothetical protein MTP03_23020 [Tsukamurella sp. PLM1]
MRELFAFFGRELVGTFRDADGVVSFDYVDDYAGPPLSLSLPLGERPPAADVHAYLDNLLPDHQQLRARWARERGLSSADWCSPTESRHRHPVYGRRYRRPDRQPGDR